MIQRFVYDEAEQLEQIFDVLGSEETAIAMLAFACHLQPSEWPKMTNRLKLAFLTVLCRRMESDDEQMDSEDDCFEY